MKLISHHKAVKLRQKGFSYSEILSLVPVSRSTLSLWLRNISLTKDQFLRIERKKSVGSRAGAASRHQAQVKDTNNTVNQAIKEIGQLSMRELWLIGIALYWAEGSKQKESNISQGVSFSNSDPDMLKLFITWIEKALKIQKHDLVFEIYLHSSKSADSENVINYWYNTLSIPKTMQLPVYFKKSISVSKKYNADYHGLVRIKIRKSTRLNRKISGWIKGLHWGIV